MDTVDEIEAYLLFLREIGVLDSEFRIAPSIPVRPPVVYLRVG